MATSDYTIKQELLAKFAKALGHPARIAICDFLAKQETCYFGEINEELPIAKATVSQHLTALKEAGLIQGEIEAPTEQHRQNYQKEERNIAGQSIQKVENLKSQGNQVVFKTETKEKTTVKTTVNQKISKK